MASQINLLFIFNKISLYIQNTLIFWKCGLVSFSSLSPWHFSSVQFSLSVVSDSLWPHESQHAWPPCPSPAPGVYPNTCPLNQWCHPTISSSVTSFSFCPKSFPESRSFSGLFGSSHQVTKVSASVLPMLIQGWFPLELTGLISLLSKGLSRVFSNTTIRKQQFFGSQLSLWSNSHICTRLLEKP